MDGASDCAPAAGQGVNGTTGAPPLKPQCSSVLSSSCGTSGTLELRDGACGGHTRCNSRGLPCGGACVADWLRTGWRGQEVEGGLDAGERPEPRDGLMCIPAEPPGAADQETWRARANKSAVALTLSATTNGAPSDCSGAQTTAPEGHGGGARAGELWK